MRKTDIIGRIVSVSSRQIIGEIFASLGLYVNTSYGINFIGEVGSFVVIRENFRSVVLEITGIAENHDEKPFFDDLRKPESKRVLFLSPIGEITNSSFIFGVSKLPFLFSEICMITPSELDIILYKTRNIKADFEDDTVLRLLTIGTSSVFPDYKVKIDIDRFFGAHFAILGNTGAGKSNTLARIVQTIFQKQHYSAYGARFIILDANSEYHQAFWSIANKEIQYKYLTPNVDNNIDSKYSFTIPIWTLSTDDWSVLLHASERTQLPVLRRAILFARVFADPESSDIVRDHILVCILLGLLNSSDTSPSKSDKTIAILNRGLSTNITLEAELPISTKKGSGTQFCKLGEALSIHFGQFVGVTEAIGLLNSYKNTDKFEIELNKYRSKEQKFSFKDFESALELAALFEGSLSSQRILEYTAPLSMRLQSLKESYVGRILDETPFSSTDEYIEDILGQNQLLILDIGNLDDSTGEVVSNVFTKILYDYVRKSPCRASQPYNLIVEEAHRYIRNSEQTQDFNIFERIAKEGRKFGFLLGVSSQRPSELSKTVISQCSNFIIHRIQNPDDLLYISRMVPYINDNSISRLTYLPTGNALVFGSGIQMPMIVEFALANPETLSQSAKISEHWYIPSD